MEQFISKEILDELSYCSTLGKSLKQISLSKTPIETIIQDIGKYRANYVDVLVQENLIGSRFKSDTPNEARCLPGTLEALRAEGVQIVVLDSPEIYPEYSPYTYVEDMKEYIDKVVMLNAK